MITVHLVQHLNKSGKIHEEQAGFCAGRCCIDDIFTLNELIQGPFKEGKKTLAFFIFKKPIIRFHVMACGLSYGTCG